MAPSKHDRKPVNDALRRCCVYTPDGSSNGNYIPNYPNRPGRPAPESAGFREAAGDTLGQHSVQDLSAYPVVINVELRRVDAPPAASVRSPKPASDCRGLIQRKEAVQLPLSRPSMASPAEGVEFPHRWLQRVRGRS